MCLFGSVLAGLLRKFLNEFACKFFQTWGLNQLREDWLLITELLLLWLQHQHQFKFSRSLWVAKQEVHATTCSYQDLCFDQWHFRISLHFIIATLPQVYDIYKRHNHNATMEDVEVMVFPLLGPWLFVRLGTTILFFVEPFDSLQSFKKWQFLFSISLLSDQSMTCSLLTSHFQIDWNLGPSGTKK